MKDFYEFVSADGRHWIGIIILAIVIMTGLREIVKAFRKNNKD